MLRKERVMKTQGTANFILWGGSIICPILLGLIVFIIPGIYLMTRWFFVNHIILYEKINDRWEVIVSYNDNSGLEQVSFVNGIWTLKGGKHVDYIVNQITKNMIEVILKKNKIN